MCTTTRRPSTDRGIESDGVPTCTGWHPFAALLAIAVRCTALPLLLLLQEPLPLLPLLQAPLPQQLLGPTKDRLHYIRHRGQGPQVAITAPLDASGVTAALRVNTLGDGSDKSNGVPLDKITRHPGQEIRSISPVVPGPPGEPAGPSFEQNATIIGSRFPWCTKPSTPPVAPGPPGTPTGPSLECSAATIGPRFPW